MLITFVTPRVAGIQEAEDSQRAVAARERSKDFDIAGNHAVTAKIVAVRIGRIILRTERARIIAAHRADAAHVEVFEEGELIRTAVDVAPADLAVKSQSPGTRERNVVLVLVSGFVVLNVKTGEP